VSRTELFLVRHGESAGNVAATDAEGRGVDRVEVTARDADVALTELGRSQATGLGDAFGRMRPDQQPDTVLGSPYQRAYQTAQIVVERAGLPLTPRIDERLRDRDLGILDRLTVHGVETLYAEEAARRRWLGKFYYRPPGGESWADVALRVRSFLSEVDAWFDGRRLLVVTHDVVIVIFRYVCEELSEEQASAITRTTPLRNTSVTHLVRADSGGEWKLLAYNDVSHLEAADVPTTGHSGGPDAAG
jgi:glucosyl-3-phosphoglycerate phosphatase